MFSKQDLESIIVVFGSIQVVAGEPGAFEKLSAIKSVLDKARVLLETDVAENAAKPKKGSK